MPSMVIFVPERVKGVPEVLVPKLPPTLMSFMASMAPATPEKVMTPPPLEEALVKVNVPDGEPSDPAINFPPATTDCALIVMSEMVEKSSTNWT